MEMCVPKYQLHYSLMIVLIFCLGLMMLFEVPKLLGIIMFSSLVDTSRDGGIEFQIGKYCFVENGQRENHEFVA